MTAVGTYLLRSYMYVRRIDEERIIFVDTWFCWFEVLNSEITENKKETESKRQKKRCQCLLDSPRNIAIRVNFVVVSRGQARKQFSFRRSERGEILPCESKWWSGKIEGDDVGIICVCRGSICIDYRYVLGPCAGFVASQADRHAGRSTGRIHFWGSTRMYCITP